MMHIKRRVKVIFIIVFTLLASSLVLATDKKHPENITLYSHYEMPPFVTSENKGLTYTLANKLNNLASGKYRFDVKILPRKRLDSVIQTEGWRGIVPWVNPVWFQDDKKSRYSWSKVIMRDKNLVISHQLKPISYEGASSLRHLTLGGILGHRYAEIEPLLKSKDIIRKDVTSELQNIEKLLLNRIDVLFMPQISLNFYIKNHPKFKQEVYVSEKVRGEFDRFFLLPKNANDLTLFINRHLPEIKEIEGIGGSGLDHPLIKQ